MITFNLPLHFSCNSEPDTDTEHWNGKNANESLCHTRSKHITGTQCGHNMPPLRTIKTIYLSIRHQGEWITNISRHFFLLAYEHRFKTLASLTTWITSAQLCMDGCKETEDLLGLKGGTNRWSQRHKGALYLTISQSQQSIEAGKTERQSRT